MSGLLGLRKQVSSQERRNNELAASNTTLRKQVAKLQSQEADLKKRNATLEVELKATKVSGASMEVEVEVNTVTTQSLETLQTYKIQFKLLKNQSKFFFFKCKLSLT